MRERESAIASAMTSRSNSRSRNPSPRPVSRGYDIRSRPQSPLPQTPASFSDANSIPVPVRNATPRNQTPLRSPPRARSPPRGPAALRGAPPTGPSATRNFNAANGTPASSRYPAAPVGPQSSSRADFASRADYSSRTEGPPRAEGSSRVEGSSRSDVPVRAEGPARAEAPSRGADNRPRNDNFSRAENFPRADNFHRAENAPRVDNAPRADATSPTIPPVGPRGYVPPQRGGSFNPRGGRGAWPGPSSRLAQAPNPSSPAVPTGPRASVSGASSPSLLTPRTFNPPTGPAAQGGQRMSVAQREMASMTPLIPGGRLQPESQILLTGVIAELQPHHRRLMEDEERIRASLAIKAEKARAAIREWDRLEAESNAWRLKSEASAASLAKLVGEDNAGTAF